MKGHEVLISDVSTKIIEHAIDKCVSHLPLYAKTQKS